MRFIPQQLNNSFLSDWAECQRRAQIGDLWGVSSTANIHLTAGGAFAAGLEATRRAFYEKNLSSDEALAVGVTTLWREFGHTEVPANAPQKSPLNMSRALVYALKFAWPLTSSIYTPTGFEFSFAMPLPANHPITGQCLLHPETRAPFLYVGRADMMVRDPDGRIFIVDDKTASELGDSWHKQWEKASQFSGYLWAARESGIDAKAVMVRAVALYKSGSLAHREFITHRTTDDIEAWLVETCDRVADLITYHAIGRTRFRLGKECGSSFGGCPFLNVCTYSNANLAAHFSSVERTRWDSVNRVRIPVVEEMS